MQYQAGYFLNSIYDLFLNHHGKDKVEKIVFQLGHFDLESSEELEHTNVDKAPEIKTILNLLQKGVPSIPPVFIADIFSATFGHTLRHVSNSNHISHAFTDDSLADELYKAIHIIDPRITLDNQKEYMEEEAKAQGLKGTRFNFKYSYFPEYLGPYFLQLIEENRTYGSFIESSGIKNQDKLRREFKPIIECKQDFVLEMPYVHQNGKGIAIELDDTPSETSYDYEIDQLKQNLCKKIAWAKPLHIETHRLSEINGQLHPFIDYTYNEYFDIIAKNYRSPLYKSIAGLTALQYALSPIAIARIERTILEYLLSGKLKLNAPTWKIGVIERDVPCAYLAFQIIKLHFENLFALKADLFKFPEIKLTTYYSTEFKNAQLNTIYPGDIRPLENFDQKAEFDLLIDISVLQRSGLINQPLITKAKRIATIRSVRSISARYKLQTDKNIQYADFYSSKIEEKVKDKAKHALKYFLRNIFRKDGFLPGQLELINHSFQQKNTLGLLPPAGGKTIAAQLAALLQPGVSFVLCPDPHLVLNQVYHLKKMRMTNIAILDETIASPDKWNARLEQLENSEIQFVFVTPDSLRSLELRQSLEKMEVNKIFISYFIADEAHCVSEWGHDFSPAYYDTDYLKEQFVKNPVRQPVTTIALSSTAGWSCITDIQRKFRIGPDQIVRSEIKPSKIKFRLFDKPSHFSTDGMNDKEKEPTYGITKKKNLSEFIKEQLSDKGTGKDLQNLLIFCPDIIEYKDITGISANKLAHSLSLEFEELRIAPFHGTSINKIPEITIPELQESFRNSESFCNNETDILLASPSYRGGTNKPDTRNIFYLSPPSSIESFVQGAYRAGFEDEMFNCSILIDNRELSLPESSPVRSYCTETRINSDKYLAYSDILLKYKGKTKEMAILQKLWNGFGPYPMTYTEIISRQIEKNFKIDVSLVFQPETDAKRVYIYHHEKSYGFVDLSSFKISADESDFEKAQSEAILRFAAKQIKKRNVTAENVHHLLTSPFQEESQAGIAKILENLSSGSFTELEVPFENNGMGELFRLLNEKHSSQLTRTEVRQFYFSSLSHHDFIEEIENHKPIDPKSGLKDKLKEFYYQTWSRNEMELAIYRLSKSGVIEDFRIDHNRQLFILKIRKNELSFYRNLLFQQFDDFLMPEKAEEEKKKKYTSKETDVYTLLMSHLDFFYTYVIRYRFDSIESLYQILRQVPANQKVSSEINMGLKELMDRYFSAKYAMRHFSLVPGTKSLMENQQDFGIISTFISNLGPIKENWLHLKKSCELISRIKPENHLVYLLDACASIFGGEQKEFVVDKAFDQIARGFLQMRKRKDYEGERFQDEINNFLKTLYTFRPDLKENYEQVLWLKMHYLWLNDFNKKLDQAS